jgi:hypothetical protein
MVLPQPVLLGCLVTSSLLVSLFLSSSHLSPFVIRTHIMSGVAVTMQWITVNNSYESPGDFAVGLNSCPALLYVMTLHLRVNSIW